MKSIARPRRGAHKPGDRIGPMPPTMTRHLWHVVPPRPRLIKFEGAAVSALVVFLLDAASWGMQGGLSEDSLLGLIVRVALGVNFGLFWGRVRLRRYYRRWYRDHPLGDSELLMFVFSRWAEENRRSAPWN